MEKLAERLRKNGRTLLLAARVAALDRAREIDEGFAGLGPEIAADVQESAW